MSGKHHCSALCLPDAGALGTLIIKYTTTISNIKDMKVSCLKVRSELLEWENQRYWAPVTGIICELQYCSRYYMTVADKTVAICYEYLRCEVQTVVVSRRCLPSESVNGNAAVIRPPLDSGPASKTSDTTMAHLMRGCEPCMSGGLARPCWTRCRHL